MSDSRAEIGGSVAAHPRNTAAAGLSPRESIRFVPDTPIAVVGHPFSSTGMGQQLRSGVAALRAAALAPQILDIFRCAPRMDPDFHSYVAGSEIDRLPDDGIRIFHINGDEIPGVLEALDRGGSDFGAGYNVIMPAWELPIYPDPWMDQVRRFDEVWAMSLFVERMFAGRGVTVRHIGQSIEFPIRAFLPRRHFRLRESAFTLLGFFDSSSYVARKNPYATIGLYHRLREKLPYADIQLVLKVKEADADADEWTRKFRDAVPDARLISGALTSYEVHSLLACCDCLISLHRSEGFGRSPAEAMYLSKLAVATGWSGNLDFMTEANSLLVDFSLVPVLEGEYPYWQNQVWGEPDLDHALYLLHRALTDSDWARRKRTAAREDMLRNASDRAVGVRALTRLAELL